MKQKHKRVQKRSRWARIPKGWYINAVGAVGYLLLAYGTAISLSCVALAVVQLSGTAAPVASEPTPASGTSLPLGDFGSVVGAVVTAVMVVVTVLVLFFLPYIVGRYGSRVVHTLVGWLRINKTSKDLLLFKLLLSALLLAVLVVVSYTGVLEPTLQSALLLVQGGVTLLTMLLFITQHALARRHKRVFERIW